jgi:hypothetical protein
MPTNVDRNLATITYLQSAIEDALGIPRARVFVARASRNTANQGATPSAGAHRDQLGVDGLH